MRYSLFEMIRNRWLFFYSGFYLLVTFGLLFMSQNLEKVLISLTNLSLILTPLIGLLFGVVYYYNSYEFLSLLLTQAKTRWSVVSGLFGGLVIALCISIGIGIGMPLIFYGIFTSGHVITFLTLLLLVAMLSVIFSLIGFSIGLWQTNQIRGLSITIFYWLFMAILYDGIFLLMLLAFRDYPLDGLTIFLTMLNPIDLSRILMLQQFDASAMMGYTGAVLFRFLGQTNGSILIVVSLLAWIIIPLLGVRRMVRRKDF